MIPHEVIVGELKPGCKPPSEIEVGMGDPKRNRDRLGVKTFLAQLSAQFSSVHVWDKQSATGMGFCGFSGHYVF